MDPEANRFEQIRLSREALAIQDNCSDGGEYDGHQTVRLTEIATRLAELVIALHEWNLRSRPVSAGL